MRPAEQGHGEGEGLVTGTLVAEAIPSALLDLHGALHKTTIYPMGHPVVRGAVERARDRLAEALASRSPLRVGVARDHFLLDRVPMTDGPATLGVLAQLLHDLDVAVLELHAGISSAEIESFLRRIGEARRSGKGGTALASALDEDKIENVRIFPIDYHGLSFVAGPVASSEKEAGKQDIWECLVLRLADLTDSSSSDPRDLAEEINRQMADDEGVGTGLLRREVQSVGQKMHGMDAPERAALRTRLASFVTALTPGLRQDLLRIDPREADGSAPLLAEITPDLPDSVLAEILHEISKQGERVHEQLVDFLNKLSHVSPEQASGQASLESALQRWGAAAETITDDPQALHSALRAILTRGSKSDCIPREYRAVLDDLTHRQLSPVATTLLTRYRDPQEPKEVLAQSVEIAVRLLTDEESDEHVKDILGFVEAAIDPLLGAGRFHPVLEAVVAARAVGGREGGREDARQAAADFIGQFSEAKRIDLIVEQVRRSEGLPVSVEPLLALGGTHALDRILDGLGTDAGPTATNALQHVAVGMSRDTLTQVLESRAKEGWDRLRPMFPLFRLMAPEDARGFLESLRTHPDPRVRREALSLLCQVDSLPGAPEAHLRRALGDSVPSLVATAVRSLAALGTREALDALGEYLEGSMSGVTPDPIHVRRVVSAMLGWGSDGLDRLCRSLMVLRAGFQPSKARVGWMITKLLEVYEQDPRVARARLRWWLSPAGVVSLFLPGGGIDPAEEDP